MIPFRLFANYLFSISIHNYKLLYNTINIADDYNNDLFYNQFHNFNFNSFIIYEYEIIDFIGSLIMTRQVSIGPDGIPTIFLKMCCHYLFYLSLSSGTFPLCWKKSFISPIHKSGDKQNVKNYRPVSKMSILPKMFEAIISKKLSNLLCNNISFSQHGFVFCTKTFYSN